MKNLHLIPTEKPSRLTKINDELFFGKNEREMLSDTSLNIAAQNIYITSNEEIKEGDAVIHDFGMGYELENPCDSDNLKSNTRSKIILTTDQDLIADGVQAIDDEFLEWFVKNPSCESVEVNYIKTPSQIFIANDVPYGYYKIIIPQETLEEAADRLAKKYGYDIEGGKVADFVDGVVRGAEWQSKRMYSEEEVIDLLQKMNDWPTICEGRSDIEEWFEQFKKK